MNPASNLPRRENHMVGWILILSPQGEQEVSQKVNKGLDGFVGDYGLLPFCYTRNGFGFGLRKPHAPLPMTTWSFAASDRGVCFLEGVFYDAYESHPVDGGEDPEFAPLVLDAFLRLREKAVARLSGSFAGFVFEPDTGRLHTFVDRCGTKAVYWSRELGDLIVASNLAVFRCLKALSVDQVAAFQFVTIGFPVGERTLLEDVRVQLPGSINTFRETSHQSVRYWEIPSRAKDAELRDSVELISQSLEDCVDRLAARAKQPVGLGLTNGHDSRVVFNSLLYRKVPFEVVVWREGNPNDRVVDQLCSLVGKEPREVREAQAQADQQSVFAYSDGQTLYGWGFFNLGNRSLEEGLGCLLLGYTGDWISGGYAVPAAQYLRRIDQLTKSSLAYQMELLSFSDAVGVLGDIPHAISTEAIAEWTQSFVREASAESLSHVEILQGFANRNFKRLRYAMMPALKSVQLLFPYLDNKVLEAYFSLPERAFYLQRAHCYAGFYRFNGFGDYQCQGYPVPLRIEARFPEALYLIRLARIRMRPALSLVERFRGGEKWRAKHEEAYREVMQSGAVNRGWLAALRRDGKLSLTSLRKIHTLSRFIDVYVRGENRHIQKGFLRQPIP
jgi:asparagine synthetase B (glutamine-hydrolysing)